MKEINSITDTHLFFAGTSGLVLPVPNKQSYPEEYRDKSRLSFYASLFNTIEINSSFYKIPMGKTIARWADSVPDHFKFTFKLWKGITHNKSLVFDEGDVRRFMEVIAHAGNKKGCLLVQFPASITAEYVKPFRSLMLAIRHADKNSSWNLSVEFRHASWYKNAVYEWLLKRNVNIVSHDIAPVTPFSDSGTGWVYLRFHGPEKGYRGSYSDATLKWYADEIRSFTAAGKTVYAYFNNTLGSAVSNLQTLKILVASGHSFEVGS